MAFDWWRQLPDDEKLAIVERAKEVQDIIGRHTCFWCGASLTYQGYDYTSNARDPREICKGQCQQRRFFDDPDI